jgi:cytochrome d ubiquinol oxidase subunit I
MKLAAIEAMWDTEPPPASFALFGFPDVANRTTHFSIHIPWVMGIIGTRSLDGVLPGINELVDEAAQRIESGRIAYAAMQRLRAHPDDAQARTDFDAHKQDLGYALLLRRDMADPAHAGPADVQRAAASTIPNVPVLFWSFRIMVGCGLYFIALFAWSFWLASQRRLDTNRRYLRIALWSLPLPWIAIELGWIVAEYGRQPWAIEGVLPTALGVSSVSAGQVLFSISGFVLFYTALAVVDAMLMTKYARRGPDGLGLWPPAPPAAAPGDDAPDYAVGT